MATRNKKGPKRNARTSKDKTPTVNRRKKKPLGNRKKEGAPRRKIGRYISAVALCMLVVWQWNILQTSVDTDQESVRLTAAEEKKRSVFEKVTQSLNGIQLNVLNLGWLNESWVTFNHAVSNFSWPWSNLNQTPESTKKVQLTNVIVEGSLRYLNKNSLQADLHGLLNRHFVSLELDEVREALLKNPWIKNVSVRRVWPSALNVQIEEQQPIAIWGEKGFLNSYGDVIEIKDVSVLKDFPTLVGDDINAYDIAKEYLLISRMMNPEKLRVTTLGVSSSGVWELRLNDRFSLLLGKHDLSMRIERFMYLFEKHLKPYQDKIHRVDMRYSHGIAVQWHKEKPHHSKYAAAQ